MLATDRARSAVDQETDPVMGDHRRGASFVVGLGMGDHEQVDSVDPGTPEAS